MTTTTTTTWFEESLRSSCCRAPLAAVPPGATCGACGAGFAERSYGLDLVPADIGSRHASYADWTAVQAALAGWRARTWDQSADAEARTRETHRLAAAFLDMSGVHGRVLDVGCGSGWIADFISARGAAYAGVDPAPVSTRYAFPFARAVSDSLPVGDGSCDSVVFFSSVDYSLDLAATLREAHRVLVPGGTLAVATPIHATREPSGERLHCHRFLRGDLEAAVASAFGIAARTHEWRENYHFVWATRS